MGPKGGFGASSKEHGFFTPLYVAGPSPLPSQAEMFVKRLQLQSEITLPALALPV